MSTKVSEAELRVLESRAERAGLTLSEWVRDVLLGSSVDAGAMAAERAILAEMLAMRAILLNFMLKLSMRQPITEQVSRELIEWADSNKMKRALHYAFPEIGQYADPMLDGSDATVHGTGVPTGSTLAIRQLGTQELFMTKKLNGRTLNAGSLRVSADGRILTETYWRPEAPDVKAVLVYEKQ